MEPLRVECYAGYQAEQEPVAVHLDGARRRVVAVEDRWRDPAAGWYRVRLDDDRRCLLRHDRGADRWELASVSA